MLIPQFCPHCRERECNSDAGTFLIGQEDRQQCMSGPIITKCARTARKRGIGALAFLRLSEDLEENLDNKLLWATLPHETTEKGRMKKTENLYSARTWPLEGQWRVIDSHSAAVCCSSRPTVGLFYKAVPVLAHEDKFGGSAIHSKTLQVSTLIPTPGGLPTLRPPPP